MKQSHKWTGDLATMGHHELCQQNATTWVLVDCQIQQNATPIWNHLISKCNKSSHRMTSELTAKWTDFNTTITIWCILLHSAWVKVHQTSRCFFEWAYMSLFSFCKGQLNLIWNNKIVESMGVFERESRLSSSHPYTLMPDASYSWSFPWCPWSRKLQFPHRVGALYQE